MLAAACGGSSSGSGDGSASDVQSSSGGLVAVASVDGSDVLVNGSGSTLYTTSAEDGGHIKCVDGCESFWKPLLATAQQARTASHDLDAKLSVVQRPEGDMQLTFDGLPLYSFTQEGSDQLTGDGFVDDFQGTHFEWQAARTDSGSAAPAPAPTAGSSTPDDNGYGY